jgi:hypothetical protein
VLLKLGRERDVEGLRRLARSIRRYTDPGEDGGGQVEPAEGLAVVASRPLGGAWLLDALWRRLGVAEALLGLLGPRRFATDVERVLFALVCNRALAPARNGRRPSGPPRTLRSPALERMDDDQAYRALDLLVEADADAKVHEAVFFACADLLNLEVDLHLSALLGGPGLLRSRDRRLQPDDRRLAVRRPHAHRPRPRRAADGAPPARPRRRRGARPSQRRRQPVQLVRLQRDPRRPRRARLDRLGRRATTTRSPSRSSTASRPS